MRIGPHTLNGNAVLTPMAGVTDRPFRLLCRKWEAAFAASEMFHASARLRNSLLHARIADIATDCPARDVCNRPARSALQRCTAACFRVQATQVAA